LFLYANDAEGTMETTLFPETEVDEYREEDAVHEWRVHQLWQLGVPRLLAEVVADAVDWHDVAALVGRGCEPVLALEIAR
jgi:hypothetical protein